MWASDDEQRHRVMASSGLGTHLYVVVSSQWLLCTQSVQVHMLLYNYQCKVNLKVFLCVILVIVDT